MGKKILSEYAWIKFGSMNSISQLTSAMERFSNINSDLNQYKLINSSFYKNLESVSKFSALTQSYLNGTKHFQNLQSISERAQVFSQFARLANFPLPSVLDKLKADVEELQLAEYLLLEEPEELTDDHSSIIVQTNRIKEVISEIYSNNEILFKIEPRRFEEVIAELLYHQGFQVELTKQTRDAGFDILAVKDLHGFPLKFLVECKRFASNRPVGIEIIRSFCDVIKEQKANKGLIVTTSYFSQPAVARQNLEGNVLDFRDRLDLMDWVKKYLGHEK